MTNYHHGLGIEQETALFYKHKETGEYLSIKVKGRIIKDKDISTKFYDTKTNEKIKDMIEDEQDYEVFIIHNIGQINIKNVDVNVLKNKLDQKQRELIKRYNQINNLTNFNQALKKMFNEDPKNIQHHESGIIINPKQKGFYNLMNSAVEITSIFRKDKTVSQIIEEIEIVREIYKIHFQNNKFAGYELDYSPYGGYRFVVYDTKIGDLEPKINIDKIEHIHMEQLGSYHINLTLVNDDNKYQNFVNKLNTNPSNRNPDTPFYNEHKYLAVLIQWLTPLLMATYSYSDNMSIFDNHKLSETTLRMFYQDFSYFLTRNIHKDGFDIVKHKSLQRGRYILDIPGWTKQIYENLDYEIAFGTEKLKKDPYAEDVGHEHLNKTPFIIGADFRRRYPLNWRNLPDKFTPTGHTYSLDPTERFGFEFRVLDLFDIKYIKGIFQLFLLLADYGIHNKKLDFKNIENPYNNEKIIDILLPVLKEGWNTNLANTNYINYLNNIFPGINFTEQKPYHILNDIFLYLFNKYDKQTWQNINLLNGELTENDKFNIMNLNRLSWTNNFKIYFNNLKSKDQIIEKLKDTTRDQFLIDLAKIVNKDKKIIKEDLDDIIYSLENMGYIFVNNNRIQKALYILPKQIPGEFKHKSKKSSYLFDGYYARYNIDQVQTHYNYIFNPNNVDVIEMGKKLNDLEKTKKLKELQIRFKKN